MCIVSDVSLVMADAGGLSVPSSLAFSRVRKEASRSPALINSNSS